jgi:hypothetical protein
MDASTVVSKSIVVATYILITATSSGMGMCLKWLLFLLSNSPLFLGFETHDKVEKPRMSE